VVTTRYFAGGVGGQLDHGLMAGGPCHRSPKTLFLEPSQKDLQRAVTDSCMLRSPGEERPKQAWPGAGA
jgi:hypothetical protein